MFGSMDLVKRKQELEDFVNGESKFLVVTDLCARGIDIPDVEVVINFDFPSQLKTFVHRCGRTARIDREGASYTLINREEVMYLAKLGEVLEYREISLDFTQRPEIVNNEEKKSNENIIEEENSKEKPEESNSNIQIEITNNEEKFKGSAYIIIIITSR